LPSNTAVPGSASTVFWEGEQGCFRIATNRRRRYHARGFTLIELLITIAIIALLSTILVPAIERAYDAAGTVRCASNLRSIGQGLIAYAGSNNGYLPVSWSFQGTTIDPSSGVQTPTAAVYGYVHWSSFIFGNSPPENAFECPSHSNLGFPACDPLPGKFDFGQTIDSNDSGGSAIPAGTPGYGTNPVTALDGNGTSQSYYPDQQAVRCAYTLNEGLCGTNFWTVGFQPTGAPNAGARLTRLVGYSQIENASGTILATEFVNEWGIVSGVNRSSPPCRCKSYRAVHGWIADSTGSGGGGGGGGGSGVDPTDLPYLPIATQLRRTTASDLWQLPSGGSGGATQSLDIVNDYQQGNYPGGSQQTRLDFVGRNHGTGQKPADRKTNFLYVDGHIETKSILQTVPAGSPAAVKAGTSPNTPWEWGAQPYSIQPNVRSVNN